MISGNMVSTRREKLFDRTEQLQSAITHIHSVRSLLCKNSREIKCQIRANISRQMEALRSREVCLLNQVDLLQCAKDEALRNQQVRLDTALSSTNKTLQILSDGDGSVENSDIDCLSQEDMKPAETPHLMFHVDSVGLRESIVNYGKIETAGFPDKFVFTGRHDSASLPKAFEDYDDGDHHMMYKTLSSNHGSVSLPGSFRRMKIHAAPDSPTTNQWLLKPTTTTTPTTSSRDQSSVSPGSTCNDLSDWLRAEPSKVASPTNLRHVPSDASICSWLHQLKTSPHMEDDDLELMDAIMDDSLRDAKPLYGLMPSHTMTVTQYLPQMHATPSLLDNRDMSRWLRNVQTGDTTYPHSLSIKGTPSPALQQSYDVVSYFRVISEQDDGLWLKDVAAVSPAVSQTVKSTRRTNGWILERTDVSGGMLDEISRYHDACDWLLTMGGCSEACQSEAASSSGIVLIDSSSQMSDYDGWLRSSVDSLHSSTSPVMDGEINLWLLKS